MTRRARHLPSVVAARYRSRRCAAESAAALLSGAAVWALLVTATACSAGSVAGDATGIAPLVGEWRGVLLSDGGELPFHFRVNSEGSYPAAVVTNAGVEQPLISVNRQGAASYTLTFFNDSDSQLVAKMSPDGTELFGYWQLTYDPPPPEGVRFKPVTQMPFTATKNDQRRFQRNDPTLEIASPEAIAALPDVSGEWEVREVAGDYFDQARSYELVQDGEKVIEEIVDHAPPFLDGIYRNGLLRLSSFDGYRALLLHARATPDGRLEGTLWMADQSEARWSARRPEATQ